MQRVVQAEYVDPLSAVWLGAAAKIGLQVVRTPDSYAATDGNGTLAIGAQPALDADDSLAQMIFHELCHSLIEGPTSFAKPDWGMDNTGPDHDWREHACLRLQFTLCRRYGLLRLFAPTTDFRTFWNSLSGDALADRSDLATQAAILGLQRVQQEPWAPALEQALQQTAAIAAALVGVEHSPTSLWHAPAEPAATHPSGFAVGAGSTQCGDCAWLYQRGRSHGCRQFDAMSGPKRHAFDPAWKSCERFEASLDCLTCGACCREAYHAVEVTKRDHIRRTHPALVVLRDEFSEMKRVATETIVPPKHDDDPPFTRCIALSGGDRLDSENGPRRSEYSCTVYNDRPRSCRDFTLGSKHCLQARQRVGLTW